MKANPSLQRDAAPESRLGAPEHVSPARESRPAMTPQEQRVFDLVKLELKPEMVPPEYRGKVASKFCGHCHHATLAMYELLGGKNNGYKVRKAVDELQIKHYWLESPSGEIIDPTAEQYTDLNRPLPYGNRVTQGVSHLRSNHARSIISSVQRKLSQG